MSTFLPVDASLEHITTREDALELSLDDYLRWCWQRVKQAAQRDATLAAVLASGQSHGGDVMLEALWAKAYWFNRIEKLENF